MTNTDVISFAPTNLSGKPLDQPSRPGHDGLLDPWLVIENTSEADRSHNAEVNACGE